MSIVCGVLSFILILLLMGDAGAALAAGLVTFSLFFTKPRKAAR